MKYLLIVIAMCAVSCAGKSGHDGATGSDGKDGTAPTTILFCPGLETSYYGLCIENKVFAVFNNGTINYIAYLPAGTYTTVVGSASCTITVTANSCIVQ